MADQPAPKTEPRKFLGQPVTGVGMSDRGPTPRSFWEAAASEFSFRGKVNVVERWRTIFESEGEPLLQGEFEDKIGDRDIPFEPGITANETDRRIMFYDFEQHESRLEQRGVAQFLGGFGPMLGDPATVFSLPFGGANIARASAAKLLSGMFFKQSALAGTKAGVATFPLELGFQKGETAQIRPGELAGAAIGPILATPLLGAAGRGIRTMLGRNGPEINAANRNLLTDGRQDPIEVTRIINQAERDGVPAPPIAAKPTADPTTPTARLRDTFADYKGGHRQWVRDLAAGRETARQKADDLGFSPDDPALTRMVDRLSRASDQRSNTPTDYNARVLDTFNQFRQGEQLDADQVRLLSENGLVRPRARADAEGNLRPAEETPTPEAVTNVGTRLAEALDAPRNVRNAKLLRKVNTEGVGAVRNDLEARARAEAGDPPAPGARAGAADPPEPGPRIIDDEFDDADVVEALLNVRTRPDLSNPKNAPDTVEPLRPANVDPDSPTAATRQAAQQRADAAAKGIDVDEIDSIVKRVMEGARTCGK